MHTNVNDLAVSLEAFECSFLKLKPVYLVWHRTSKKNIRWDCLNSIKDQSKFEDQNSVYINIFGFK